MRRLLAAGIAALCLAGLLASARAQESTAAALPLMEDELAEQRAPVAVPEPTPEAVRYYRSGHLVWAASHALGLAIPALLLLSGFAVALRARIERVARFWPFALALFFALYSLADWLLGLPFAYYAGFMRQHAYGLSNQSLDQWLREGAIGLGVSIAVGMSFLWVPYALMRRLPRAWWLVSGALLVPFLFLMMLVRPIWIDPLTDDFGPMRNAALEQRILGLAQRAGIDGARVFEVEKSADTNALNAYVTGFGATKRIVLWDTLLARLSPEQVLVVMGHEMGHYVMRHVAKGIVIYAAIATLGLGLVQLAARRLLTRHGARLGLRGLCDPAALPLVLVLLGVATFLLMPAALAVSRSMEHEADRFALEITRDNHACANAFVGLQTGNLGYPRPGALYVAFRASHPPLGARIDFCNAYRPWERGGPLRYGHLFQR
jgi:Zn-dependent protease with chaperone function